MDDKIMYEYAKIMMICIAIFVIFTSTAVSASFKAKNSINAASETTVIETEKMAKYIYQNKLRTKE